MLRRSVTYLLILSVAAGPMLCCCTAGRLHAASPSHPESTSSKAPSSRPKVSHSCCSQKQRVTDAEVGQKTSPTKPAPQKPTEKCPCKDKDSTDKAKVSPQASTSADVNSLLRLALSFDVVNVFAAECFA